MTSRNPPELVAERYRLKKHLGSGGFADVYLADDERLQRDVAIKFLRPDRLQQSVNSERFFREARTVARLTHPNIVQVYDMGEAAGWLYLVMEYITGQSLRDLMSEQNESLPLDEAVELLTAILNGLDYAHSNGVIHRDIKPENILLTADNQVKISDFGLALHQDDVRLTESGAFVGTLLYLAPEIISGDKFDKRVDLYSVGATFYEMLTGQPPFTGETPLHLIQDILQRPLTYPTIINPEIPEAIEQIIVQLLDKAPEKRFADARSVLQALPKSDEVATLRDTMLKQTMQTRMSQSRLERLVRSSTEENRHPQDASENETTTLIQPAGQDLLLYAAQEETSEAVEAERRRLAHRLQETLLSQINLLLAQVNSYEQTIANTPQTRMAFSVLATIVRQLLQETHDLEASLHPAVLETLGLETALESLSNQQRRISGVNITLSIQRMRERLQPQLELTLFRTAQDAIERAIQQGNASQVVMQLERSETAIHFLVADNGIQPTGDILRSVRQRITSLGGSITQQASRYGGLDITVTFPIETPIDLTERELEVIQLLAEGLTNKEIAAMLGVRPRTVKFHLDNIYSKLGVTTRTEAAIYALRHGWIRKNNPA
jgi:serine/threonine protein kinase/DNA-binding CsgD family transcriptional regulator